MEGVSMSGTSIDATIERSKRETTGAAWGAEASENSLTATMRGYFRVISPPIKVNGNELEIDSESMDIGRIYQFEYLDSQMVAWKATDGAIDLFEIIEE